MGQVLGQAVQRLPHLRRDAHRVGAGFLVDRERHALHAVDRHQMVYLGIYQGDLSDVRYAHGLAAAGVVAGVADHYLGDIVHGAEARAAAQLEQLVVLFQRARGDVHVLRPQPLFQQRQRHAEGIQPIAVDADAHLLLAPARHPGFGNAGQLLQARRQLPSRQAAQLRQIRLAAGGHQAEGENWGLARVEAPHQHFLHRWIASQRADGLLHVHQRHVQIDVPIQHHGGHQAAGASHLGHLADAAHGEQLLLHAFAVQPLHLRGRAVAGADRHHHGGALQIRQQIHRQVLPREPAHQTHRQGDDGDRHRPPRREAGDGFESAHDVAMPARGRRGVTRIKCRRRARACRR